MSQPAPSEHPQLSLMQKNTFVLSAWAVVAAFGAYFCMYAFRKPFTAAKFEDHIIWWGLGFKTVLVISQVLGYTVSKFIGIKVIAELTPQRRVIYLLGLIGCAELALLLFGLTPAPYNFIWLFANGLPLGMVFGLVLSFLEGRRQTEALAAGLCASFIVADGVVKSVGTYLLEQGVSEYWMPAVAGACFVLPLLLFCWMLTQIPAPSAGDVAARSQRVPLKKTERGEFFRRYAFGLILLVLAYLLVTILRSLRADFAPEIWKGLGEKVDASVFTRTEMIVGAAVLVLNGSIVFIRDNRRAFFAAMMLAVSGAILVIIALVGLRENWLTPFEFVVCIGLGMYLPYIAVHVTLFERLIAMTRDRGNIGYLMYLADAFGYLGYVAVMLGKNLVSSPGEGFIDFFLIISWAVAIGCIVLLIPCWRYFATHPLTQQTDNAASTIEDADRSTEKDA